MKRKWSHLSLFSVACVQFSCLRVLLLGLPPPPSMMLYNPQTSSLDKLFVSGYFITATGKLTETTSP